MNNGKKFGEPNECQGKRQECESKRKKLAMASTSAQMASDSSPSNPGWTHDVFLSFRGDDTRYNFTDHLYNALVRKGIRTLEMTNLGEEKTLRLSF
ncbi:hypothetical protein CK203_112942 [Vitis vinifera]|uniref:ADP-ribosyl cyclase/cyclic ADP-ribose hydrolase n=1 Tax=Vitis vinifera TaxID=29760 RepID=A0A438DB47_VITVI|nr:hypothetical protein CK203_112942 [Vitis vinifera]